MPLQSLTQKTDSYKNKHLKQIKTILHKAATKGLNNYWLVNPFASDTQ